MQYNETQLTQLIADVEREFTAHLAKAEGTELPTLSKAEEKPKEKKPEEKPEYKEGEAKPEGEQKPPMEAKPEGEQKPPMPQGQAPQGQPAGHDYDDEDMEHMKQMYSSMSESELKAHHDCIAGLMKCGGGMMGKSEIEDENPELNSKPKDKGSDMFPDKKNGGMEGSQPHNAEGPKSEASKNKPLDKSEHDRRNGGNIEDNAPGKIPGAKSPASKAEGVQMEKSENNELDLLKSELSTANEKYEDLKKNFDAVASFLTKLVEKKAAPAGKAITSLDIIAKSEGSEGDKTLSKSEIHQILVRKSSDSTLKKSDRDAINVYYDKGQVDIQGISHLLK